MARPSKYDPSFCEKIVALGKLGKSKAQIASELGVVRKTLDNWVIDHPELGVALHEAQEFALAWWENMAQAVMIEPVPGWNATSFVFHVRQFMSGIPATHGIPFQKMATQICRRHGFDPLGF